MIFEHDPLPPFQIAATTGREGRYYAVDGERLPSVTTVLGRMLDHSWLDAWKKRVGEAEAKRILDAACARGTAIHDTAEHYLKNDPEWKARLGGNPFYAATFSDIRPHLDHSIGKVYGLELALYSKALWTAGRTDCLCDWQGVPSVIDFKTSRGAKLEEDIEGYFLQASVYAYMASTLYGKNFRQIVIIIAMDKEGARVFVKPVSDYFDRAAQLFVSHKKRYENAK